MGWEDSASCIQRPDMEAVDNHSSNPTVQILGHEMDDSKLVEPPAVVTSAIRVFASADVEKKKEVMVDESGGGKRKRGRPPKGQAKAPPPSKMKKDEEDVCFICFDGGSLVLCDRRDCPKAYHPACIKRDEAFFQCKARWDCGWHICSSCQKAAHYMCYTCPFSLCKGCTKDSDYVCVRGNKGFCNICLKTIMLIENNDPGNKEMVQVDFDDKTSWEYLFKVYWIYLKEMFSLTFNELTQAKNPWKEADPSVCKGHLKDKRYGVRNGNGSVPNMSSGGLVCSKRRKTDEPQGNSNKDSHSLDKSGGEEGTALIGRTEWASKELLEFVAHMKKGDTSILSQFDVQSLLLDYIKQNDLRDPRQKSQIICDLRLKNMFGKSRLAHFEMLKLLDLHFRVKKDFHANVVIQSNVVDAAATKVEAEENKDNILMVGRDKRSITRNKGEERRQSNLDEYAAIDVHNINLIYLQRNMLETLIEDTEKFHEKVVGSIVRIKISRIDQKQDGYRLVQVVGTRKVTVPYTVGKITADVMLEILNVDKNEVISIEDISNEEFSKDECRCLRQSIKCGLVKRPTVGDILKKATALQSVRVNDWLETEIVRLNHLRDRASEKGHEKELRECVEILQLLRTPEEQHQRRSREIPEVHADSHMDPNCKSEEDDDVELNDKKQGEVEGPIWDEKRKDAGDSEKPGNQVDSTSSLIGRSNNQAGLRAGSVSDVQLNTSNAQFSTGMAPSVKDSETEKLWQYLDPNGKIQGPFSLLQLRAWSTTGYFPPNMSIWRIHDTRDSSIQLTDALNGKFQKSSELPNGISLESREVGGDSNGRLNNSNSSNGMTIDVNCSSVPAGNLSECSNPKGTFSGTASVNPSDKGKGRQGKRRNSNPNKVSRKLQRIPQVALALQATGGQSHKNSSKIQRANFGQSSGQNSGPSTLVSVTDSLEKNPDIGNEEKTPSTATKEIDSKQCVSRDAPEQDSHIPSPGQRPSDVPEQDSHIPDIIPIPGQRPLDAPEQVSHIPDIIAIPGQRQSDGPEQVSHIPEINPIPGQRPPDAPEQDSRNPDILIIPGQGPPDAPEQDSRIPDIITIPGQTRDSRFPDIIPIPGQRPPDAPKQDSHIPDIIPILEQRLPNAPEQDSHIPDIIATLGQRLPDAPEQDSHIPAIIPILGQRPPDAPNQDSHIPDIIPILEQRFPNAPGQDSHIPDVQLSSIFPVQDVGLPVQDGPPGGCSPISLRVGNRAPIPERTVEWGGYNTASTSAKPPSSVEEWDPTLESMCSLKLPMGAHSLGNSSPSNPVSNASSWEAPIEFSTLAEESVSDLLAEVDAMESLCYLSSSAMSTMNTEALKDEEDCFGSMDELSPRPPPPPPPPDSRKNHHSGDVQFLSLSLFTGEPSRAPEVVLLDPPPRRSREVEKERNPSNVPVPSPRSRKSQDTVDMDNNFSRAGGSKAAMKSSAFGKMEGGSDSGGYKGLLTHMGKGFSSSPRDGGDRYNNGPRDSGDRYNSPRDSGGDRYNNGERYRDGGDRYSSAVEAGNSGYSSSRGKQHSRSSRPSSYSGGGGSYTKPSPTKGQQQQQRVCKFYESGYCKKGSSCGYLHPR